MNARWRRCGPARLRSDKNYGRFPEMMVQYRASERKKYEEEEAGSFYLRKNCEYKFMKDRERRS